MLPTVLNSWANWKREHLGTRVLTLETGFVRDYSPGAAYHNYFASPNLMFPAAVRDVATLKELAFGIGVPGGVKAWLLARFEGGVVLNDRVGLSDVVLAGNAATRTVRAYDSGRQRKLQEAEVFAPRQKPTRITSLRIGDRPHGRTLGGCR